MKKLRQKGSISMMLLVFVVTASGIIMSQMPKLYTSLNSLNSHKKEVLQDNTNLFSLAQTLKSKRKMFTLDGTCNTYTSPRHTRRIINGLGFCMPVSGGICALSLSNDTGLSNSLRQCIRTTNFSLDWRNTSGVAVPAARRVSALTPFSGSTSRLSKFSNKRSAIRIPATTDASVWRRCPLGPSVGCVRLSLCPKGRLTCRQRDVVSEVVVRIGAL